MTSTFFAQLFKSCLFKNNWFLETDDLHTLCPTSAASTFSEIFTQPVLPFSFWITPIVSIHFRKVKVDDFLHYMTPLGGTRITRIRFYTYQDIPLLAGNHFYSQQILPKIFRETNTSFLNVLVCLRTIFLLIQGMHFTSPWEYTALLGHNFFHNKNELRKKIITFIYL